MKCFVFSRAVVSVISRALTDDVNVKAVKLGYIKLKSIISCVYDVPEAVRGKTNVY